MIKALTIVAVSCVLVAGAAVAAFLGRDTVPVAQALLAQMLSEAAPAPAPAPAVHGPVSNKEGKKDRLAVVSYATAAYEPPQAAAALSEPLRQAYASTAPADIGLPKEVVPLAGPAAAAPKPKAVAKPQPQPQKNYALLSDGQIAGIKDRLKLSASQESYWPAVETALRGVARKIHAARQANPNVQGVPIDPDSAEVQQLKSAAMPLLFQLREDQKNEVRSLARIIGLEKVASMI
ncbi:MAG: hypothetical protein ABW175_02925 [Bradyrhizobium sp.]